MYRLLDACHQATGFSGTRRGLLNHAHARAASGRLYRRAGPSNEGLDEPATHRVIIPSASWHRAGYDALIFSSSKPARHGVADAVSSCDDHQRVARLTDFHSWPMLMLPQTPVPISANVRKYRKIKNGHDITTHVEICKMRISICTYNLNNDFHGLNEIEHLGGCAPH